MWDPLTPTKIGAICNEPDPPTVSGSREHQSLPQLPETPFTKAKRKGESRDDTNRDIQDDQPTMGIDDPFTHLRQPSEYARKGCKKVYSFYSTLGPHLTERLKSQIVSWPLLTWEITCLRTFNRSTCCLRQAGPTIELG